jgi:hypothetical protein
MVIIIKIYILREPLASHKTFLIFLGIFVLNMACRDPVLRNEILRDVQGVFQTVWSYNVPEEVNEILFCTDHDWALKSRKVDRKHPTIEAFDKVNKHTKVLQKKAENVDELLDLEEAVKQLKLVDPR